jgi:hypothetical protein
MSVFERVVKTYTGSDGEATKALYADLQQRGPIGLLALNLFRAQKASERAKLYRGGNGKGSYREQAYQKKEYSLAQLVQVLERNAFGFNYGWKEDHGVLFDGGHSWVFYLDIPEHGQMSFHSPTQGAGPYYSGEWDGRKNMVPERIVRFCVAVLQLPPQKKAGQPEGQPSDGNGLSRTSV